MSRIASVIFPITGEYQTDKGTANEDKAKEFLDTAVPGNWGARAPRSQTSRGRYDIYASLILQAIDLRLGMSRKRGTFSIV